MDNLKDHCTYVLACPRDDGTIAVLCRTNGTSPGPAMCNSKKNAIKLKTKLTNDPRGIANNRAMELIKSLYIYKIDASIEPIWNAGSLWAYLPQEKADCVESYRVVS
ncbi:MAG: hypothetical protein HOA17_08975 [Candidatus Melainabacteria bacterium]|jgi:hypothetical protein|nr:hypothetical protein [Candidatus Melainabacteria bacterium]